MRLSKSNFSMGASPAVFNTSSASWHKKVLNDEFSDKDARIALQHKNQRTNFVHQTGFEKQISTGSKGAIPSKGNLD